MKKILFVHSHGFVYGSGSQVYSNDQYPYTAWLRYLKHVRCLTVAVKYRNPNEAAKLNILNAAELYLRRGGVDELTFCT